MSRVRIGYLEAFRRIPKDRQYNKRIEFIAKYSWAIPNHEALDTIKRYSPHGAVEVGAGGGYWAHLLKKSGVNVLAYDYYPEPLPDSEEERSWDKPYYTRKKQWIPVAKGTPKVLAKVSPKRTLLLVWPPYNRPMGADCLKAFKGNTVIYVGEDCSGCTGGPEMHKILKEEYSLEEEIQIPNWDGTFGPMYDKMYVYKRRQ